MYIRYYRFLILWAFWALAAQSLAAQGFMRIYDQPGLQGIPEIALASASTPDGGMLLHYKGHIARTDAEGIILWKKTIALVPSDIRTEFMIFPDGRFLLGNYIEGHKIPNTLMFFEPDGDLLWQRTYLGFTRAARTAKGFAVWMRVDKNSFNISEIDLQGRDIWTKNYPGKGDVEFPYDVLVQTNGNLVFGFIDSSRLRLIHTSPTGNILTDTLYRQINGGLLPGRMFAAKQGGYIVQISQSLGFTLNHITNAGAIRWSKGGGSDIGFSKTIQTQDGGFFALVHRLYEPLAIRYDSTGEFMFRQKYLLPGTLDYQYSLSSTPDNGLIFSGGIHSDPYTGFVIRSDARGVAYSNLLTGQVAMDRNRNCRTEPTERPLGNWLVRAARQRDGLTFFTSTDSTGQYSMNLDTGRYVVTTTSPGPLWALCKPIHNVVFSTLNGDTLQVDFPVKDSILCPLLDISIGTNLILQCQPSTYKVRWCNNGTQAVSRAQVLVTVPSGLQYSGSSIRLSRRTRDSLWFDLGPVDIGQCSEMNLYLLATCDSVVIGQTKCVEAHIFPNKICAPPPNWSGAQVVASAKCVGDSSVEFSLRNVGSARMSRALDYIITEDVVVLRKGNFNLEPGQQTIIRQPADNKTLRIEAPQEPNFPFISMPAAGVEGCGTGQGRQWGILSQFPTDDGSPHIDIDCQVVQGIYTFNRMTAQPTGYGDRRYIAPGTAITYTTGFDNTSGDTVSTVLVRDTLSPWLDVATLQMGAASHPFTWKMKSNGVLECRFENIQLPDQKNNAAASRGFVQYSIRPRINAPLGTVIQSQVSIFADSEVPLRVAPVFHTLGRGFYTVSVQPEAGTDYSTVSVAPNPFVVYTRISVPGAEQRNLRFVLVNAAGQQVFADDFSNGQLTLYRNDLGTGTYFYQITAVDGALVGRGKMMVE